MDAFLESVDPLNKQLALGGMTMSFSMQDNTPLGFCFDEKYAPFFSTAPADAAYTISHQASYTGQLGTPVFDSGGNWRMYTLGQETLIRIATPFYQPHQIVKLAPDILTGDIVCVGEQWMQSAIHPLGYPLEELLTVLLLAQGRGVLLHASAVKLDNHGILFCGISGAGKSTMAALWDNLENTTVLSDDRVVVREHDGRLWAYGTPWHGSARISSPVAMPLDRIFVLHHAEQNETAALVPSQAVSKLLARSFTPLWDKAGMDFTLSFLDRLVKEVPCAALGFVPNETAVEYVRWLCSK